MIKCLKIAKEFNSPRDQAEQFLRIGYIPLPWQWHFHAQARQADLPNGPVDIGAGGARGPGKSHAVLAQAALDDCQRVANLKGLFLRQTGISAQESFDDLVQKVVAGKVPYKKSGTVLRFSNGSRIVLGGFQDENDIDKYIGIEYDFIIVEELNQLTDDKYMKLRGSLRTSKTNWRPRMYTSFNPGGIGHSFVKERYVTPFREKREKDTVFIPSDYRSNPYLNKEYIDYLLGLTGDLGKAWRDGEWDIFAGQIFNEFRRDIHVCPRFIPKTTATLMAGLDWGYSAPMVLLCGVFYPKKFEDIVFNRLYIYREIDGAEKTPKQWASEFKTIMNRDGVEPDLQELHRLKIYGDPAIFNNLQDSSFSIADQFKRDGIYIEKSTNNHLVKITNVHNWLSIAPDGIPYMLIAENCMNLINTLPEAQYDEHNIEDVDKDWPKDHWYDALSYLLAKVKWINARSGAFGYKENNILNPKYTLTDKQGNYVTLDPSKFAEAGTGKSGAYYKE